MCRKKRWKESMRFWKATRRWRNCVKCVPNIWNRPHWDEVRVCLRSVNGFSYGSASWSKAFQHCFMQHCLNTVSVVFLDDDWSRLTCLKLPSSLVLHCPILLSCSHIYPSSGWLKTYKYTKKVISNLQGTIVTVFNNVNRWMLNFKLFYKFISKDLKLLVSPFLLCWKFFYPFRAYEQSNVSCEKNCWHEQDGVTCILYRCLSWWILCDYPPKHGELVKPACNFWWFFEQFYERAAVCQELIMQSFKH